MSEFHIVDLISQREAVRQHSQGWSAEEVVAWLATRGRHYKRDIGGRNIFFFESAAGREAVFFFDGDQIVSSGTTLRSHDSLPMADSGRQRLFVEHGSEEGI
jgi:hypothetical protein